MRALAWTALAVAAAACQPAVAMTRDETTVAGVTVFTVGEHDDLVEAELEIEAALDDGKRVALTGSPTLLGVLKPEDVYAWPSTNTVVLDPAAGMGVYGFDANDAAHRVAVLKKWVWVDRGVVDEAARPVRATANGVHALDVDFNLSAATPSSVCRTFRRKLTEAVFGERVPASSEFRVFARELRRWCQYGNLSVHTAELPQFTIAPYRASDDPRLSLVTEWALLRNSDPLNPEGTTFLFWAKTVNEGAGSGFGRRDGTDGYFDTNRGGLRRMLDASIHSGWGPVEYDGVETAWPIKSSFPGSEKTGLFVCEGPDGAELFGCPRRPRLRTLYPVDSIEGVVTVSRAEQFTVGGTAQAGVSIDSTGKVTPNMSFSLNMVRSTTDTAQLVMHLVQTRSNTDATFYRTTRWTPDVPAIYRWINARGHRGSLADATPLASTLNPQHEIVWELPLRGNEGRKLGYNMIYEAGWNTCFNGPNCAGHTQPPDRTLAPKARVGWRDRLTLIVPYH